ncbi:MAG: transglutaminase-like domain-containing protein [Lachnospiraceae bacterium]
MFYTVKSNMIPLLYATVINSMMVDIYVKNTILWSIIVFVLQCVIFIVYASRTEKPYSYPTYYLILLMVALTAVLAPPYVSGAGMKEFVQWLVINDGTSNPFFFVSFLALTNLVLGSLVYYCTVLHQRILLNFLIVMIPFLFYYKVSQTLPNTYIVVLCILFLGVVVYGKHQSFTETEHVIIDKKCKWYLILFMAMMCMPALLVPKTLTTPFPLLKNLQRGLIIDMKSYGNHHESSADAQSTQDAQTMLFFVRGTEPMYLKRETFDYYNPKLNHWEKQDKERYLPQSLPDEDWQTFYQMVVQEAKKHPEFKKKYNIDIAGLEAVKFKKMSATVMGSDDAMSTLLHPQNTKNVKPLQDGIYTFQRNKEDMIYVTPAMSPVHYTLTYDIEEKDGNEAIVKLIKQLNPTTYRELTQELLQNTGYQTPAIPDTNNPNSTIHISSYVKSLALDITKECFSDYEKAKALEAFFHKGDFQYDLTVHSAETGIDHFLSTSKKGSCSDYATAMSLMAQSIGLPTRYTEGFQVTEYNEQAKLYNVRVADSHAFPEIYIAGRGWTIFEPTVSLEIQPEVKQSVWEQWKSSNIFALPTFFKIMGAAILVLCIVMLFTKLLREVFFRIRLRIVSSNRAIVLIYNRIWKMMLEKSNQKVVLDSDVFVEKIREQHGYDCSELAQDYDSIIYGKNTVYKTSKKKAIKSYRSIYRLM